MVKIKPFNIIEMFKNFSKIKINKYDTFEEVVEEFLIKFKT